MKCKVCGKELKLNKDKRYMVRKTKIINIFSCETICYECVDCGECGCQNILNIREEDDASRKERVNESKAAKEAPKDENKET